MPYTLYANMTRNDDPPYYDGYYPAGRPPAGDVVVDWDGVNSFGSAPNIVLYYDLENLPLLSALPSTAPAGGVGSIVPSGSSLTPLIRELSPGGFRGWAIREAGELNQRIVAASYPSHRNFCHMFSLGIPKDKLFPGDNDHVALSPTQFPSDSGFKIIWDLYDSNSDADANEYDEAFTHTGVGAFSVAGNSTNTIGQILNSTSNSGVSHFAFSQVDEGEFGNWNVIEIIKTCGANSITDNSPHRVCWTSSLINGVKTTGTRIWTFNSPFAAGGDNVTNGNGDSISMTKYAALARRSDVSPNDTQALFGFVYRAIPSIDGVTDDFKQKVYYATHSTLQASTYRKPTVPITWSGTQVSVPAMPWWANYVIVENSAGVQTAKARD